MLLWKYFLEKHIMRNKAFGINKILTLTVWKYRFIGKKIPIFSLSIIKLENRLVTVKNVFQLLGRSIAGCTKLGRGEIKFYPSTKWEMFELSSRTKSFEDGRGRTITTPLKKKYTLSINKLQVQVKLYWKMLLRCRHISIFVHCSF